MLNVFSDDDVFQVKPTKIHIFPHNSAMFEYFLSPNVEYRFYCKQLTAQIYWEQMNSKPNSWEIPITTKMTLLGKKQKIIHQIERYTKLITLFLGYCYPEDEVIIPQIRVDFPIVIFEPSLPETIVFANFKLVNLGCMPTMFKFIQPRSR